MKHFIIYDISGKILRVGSASEVNFLAQKFNDTEFITEGTCDIQNDAIDLVTKKVVPGGRVPNPIDMDYRKARQEAYPFVYNQLDMLWHGMDTDQMPKVEPFYSRIKAVKDAYPKDSSVVPGSVIIYAT